jgi:type I restriction enzyme S subunit
MKLASLGDICEFKYGRSLPESQRVEGRFPVFGSNGSIGTHVVPLTNAPAIIIGRKGSIGELNYSPDPCWPIDTTYYIDSSTTSEDIRWLYFALGSLRLTELNKATGIPGLNRNDAYERKLLLPNSDQQRRIAAILDKADSIRRKRKKTLAMADELLKSIFLQVFGDPVNNAKGFSIDEIGSHLSKTRPGTQSGPFGSSLKKHEYVDDGVPVWGVDNVQQNCFVPEAKLFITDKKYEQLYRYNVYPGDVLISRAGTVGRMCIAKPPVKKSIISTNLVRVVLDAGSLLPEYFVSLFTYVPHRLGALKANNKDSAFTFLNPKTLKALRIPIPPIGLQEEYRLITQKIEKQVNTAASQLNGCDALFLSLSQRAFRGEL